MPAQDIPVDTTPQPGGTSQLPLPADEAVAHVARLLAQDRAFVRALSAAIRSGSETAAGVTATVRTGRKRTQVTRTSMSKPDTSIFEANGSPTVPPGK
jgi:hypothetical protein